jgi:hypothetical protein
MGGMWAMTADADLDDTKVDLMVSKKAEHSGGSLVGQMAYP